MAGEIGFQNKVREVCELFHGRFTEDEAAELLTRNNGDARKTVSFIFENTAEEVSRVIKAGLDSWTTVQKVQRVRTERPVLVQARSGCIDTETRQFACAECDSSWWRRVPARKTVSKCSRCKRRYDPVPRDKEWGWAEFKCDCGRIFNGFCQFGVPSPCYNCNNLVYPGTINRPQKGDNRKRPTQRHSCAGCSALCGGQQIHGAPGGPGMIVCVHPQTRRALDLPLVVCGSHLHHSTGSTVATFLDQDNLLQDFEEIFLPPIPEEGEESYHSEDD